MFNALAIIVVTYAGFLLAYKVYGQFLGREIFKLTILEKTPAHEFQDGCDFIPTRKGVVFGHHFTSIAGTGPIVGPAIGVIWGWLPALVWVFLGSIFMGAVHDLGALVMSLRNQGGSICDIAEQLISKRVQLSFYCIVCFSLWIVIAIFGLVIAIIFNLFPESVIPVWFEIPIAIIFGMLVRRYPTKFILLTVLAMTSMGVSVIIGHFIPITLSPIFGFPVTGIWTVLLLIYAAIASILPVDKLLQPRDYINAWQLFIALGILIVGAVICGLKGSLVMVAPAVVSQPLGAPSMMPFIFITIACGAISGFHSLVASGTTAKQLNHETDAVPVGYGSMLIEGALAVMVIIACCAGIGLGYPSESGGMLTGIQAWNSHYFSWGASAGLASKLQAVVIGCANMMTSIGISQSLGVVIMGVFIASFAGTTLDTSTRLQRYIISEIFDASNLKVSVWVSTSIAVISAAILAFSSGFSGKGALQLWPLFGALNQLLATFGLGLLSIYLLKIRSKYIFVSALPFLFMAVITIWACIENQLSFFITKKWLLFIMNGIVILIAFYILSAFFDRFQKFRRQTHIKLKLN